MLPTQRYAHENYGPSAGHRFIRGQWVFDDDWLPIQEQRTSKSSRMFWRVGDVCGRGDTLCWLGLFSIHCNINKGDYMCIVFVTIDFSASI